MKLRDRARRLLGRERQFEHTVCATKVDHAVLNDVRRRAPKLNEALGTPPEIDGKPIDSTVWERLGEDLWTEFYGDDEPSLRARDRIADQFKLNRELADKNARTDAFGGTRGMTRGQSTESAIALIGTLDTVRNAYGDELKEHAERQQEIAEQQDTISDIDDALARLRQQRRDAPGGDRTVQTIDEKIRDLAQAKRAEATKLATAIQSQAQHAGDMIDAAKSVMASAAKAAEDAVEVASLLPGSEGGPGRRVSPDTMLAFADRVHGNPTLRKVLEMMGRLELSMGTVRRQLRKGGFDEMVDIEMGDELRLVLPHEKALLVHPVARLDFYRRYHERALMQYEMWSEQELKRGPVIFGADGSGSMVGPPNEFCRGLTLATCMIANREGRNCAAIEFGSGGQMAEFFFPKDRPLDTATALDFAEHFYGGGTDINQLLLRAHDLIVAEEPFHSADLVIVTDGGDRFTESTAVLRDKLRAMGVKIHGIVIGTKPTDYILQTCDSISTLFEFVGPNQTSDRLAIELT